MSTVAAQESAAATNERADSSGSWVAFIAVGLLMTVLAAASGFLFGTMQGDIPWPATPAEETIYYTAQALEWAAIPVPLLGAIAVACFPPPRVRGSRWLWTTVALVGSAILGLVVFFVAFGIAQENYLSLFTS